MSKGRGERQKEKSSHEDRSSLGRPVHVVRSLIPIEDVQRRRPSVVGPPQGSRCPLDGENACDHDVPPLGRCDAGRRHLHLSPPLSFEVFAGRRLSTRYTRPMNRRVVLHGAPRGATRQRSRQLRSRRPSPAARSVASARAPLSAHCFRQRRLCTAENPSRWSRTSGPVTGMMKSDSSFST
jgi:hypothetical protein